MFEVAEKQAWKQMVSHKRAHRQMVRPLNFDGFVKSQHFF
jgi:hypothetical protein